MINTNSFSHACPNYPLSTINYPLFKLEIKKKYYTKEAALQKLQAYCAYQERCHQEVTQKLYELGFRGDVADEITAKLIVDNFLNEERFAIAYARGKFRIKRWGKIRIRQDLKMRKIPEYSLKKAMQAIDDEGSYIETLETVIRLKSKDYEGDAQKKEKLAAHAMRKGFESDLIWETLKNWKDL
jgi:regulatory protein